MTAMMAVYLSFRGKPGASYPPFVCRAADVTYDVPQEFRWRGHRLRCVPQEEVFKTLTSSGTTGQQPSRIFLDAATSRLQQQVLMEMDLSCPACAR